MGVYIKGMKMPESCGECRWFSFNDMILKPIYYLGARCKLIESDHDWCGMKNRGAWIGVDISHLLGYGDYYNYKHCMEDGTRADDCPLVEVKTPHGKLVEFIDVTTFEDEDSGTEEVNLGEAFAAYFKMREAKPVIEAEGEE